MGLLTKECYIVENPDDYIRKKELCINDIESKSTTKKKKRHKTFEKVKNAYYDK